MDVNDSEAKGKGVDAGDAPRNKLHLYVTNVNPSTDLKNEFFRGLDRWLQKCMSRPGKYLRKKQLVLSC